jgi:tripartite-type tricarboxylate transporter receptor subunit TctC
MKRSAAFALLLLVVLGVPAMAQTYPDRPIRFYVGFPPGGSTDLISRLLGQKLSERLKQPVVVEQKVGGTGLIANDAVAKSPPDGYAMVLLTGGHPGTAAVMKKLPYDPVADFGMVGTVIEYPMVISVAPDSSIKSFAELVARAKSAPGRISFSSAGPGSLHHLLGEWLSIEAGTTMLHVPFKGAAPAYTELLGGRIDILIETATFSFPQIRGGKLRPLALSSAGRYPLMPEVQTVAEVLPGVEFSSWLGVAVAPGTPRPVIERLNQELGAILAEDDVKQRFAGFGGVPSASTPEAMKSRVEREIARWNRVVESRKIERQ